MYYCKALLTSLPEKIVGRLQLTQTAAARVRKKEQILNLLACINNNNGGQLCSVLIFHLDTAHCAATFALPQGKPVQQSKYPRVEIHWSPVHNKKDKVGKHLR